MKNIGFLLAKKLIIFKFNFCAIINQTIEVSKNSYFSFAIRRQNDDKEKSDF
jgi:hypothetical protein